MRNFATIAVVALIMSVSTQAKGENPQDCLTQENCFCMPNQSGVYVVRNGYEKGFLDNMGTGPGWAKCSNSMAIATRVGDNNVYVTDFANGGAQCSLNVGEVCRPGIFTDVFPPYDEIVYVICPGSGYLIGFERDCTNPVSGISGGIAYSMIVETSDSIIAGFDDMWNFAVFMSSGGAIQHPASLSTPKSLVWSETLGMLLINDGNSLYQTQAPWLFAPTLFLALPSSTDFMSNSESYVALSSTGTDLYVVDTAAQSVIQTINVGAPLENALSENQLCVVDDSGADPEVVGYDPETGDYLFSYTAANFGTIEGVSYMAPTQQGFCGNTIVETQDGETCDGTNLDHADCTTYDFDLGTLTCDGSCNVDTSNCSYFCGNGIAAPTELCDGNDVKGRTCQDEGFAGGTLACNASCDGFVTTSCTNCGNGQIDPGETCDPGDGSSIPQNLNGEICQTIGSYNGGQLACNTTCDAFIEDECATCGDGVADLPHEECDGSDMGGSTCTSLGLGSGTLSCYQNCIINTQSCTTVEPQCGDNNVDAGEDCDDGNRINGDGCDENCYTETADCGNGQIDVGEECDPGDGGSIPEDLNGATCESRGNLGGGTLLCTSSCRFDETYCDPGYAPEGASLDPNADPTADDLNDPQAADLYALNTETLTEDCSNAQIVEGDLVVTVPEGSYCNYGASTLQKTRDGGAWIHLFPTEEGTLPRMRITQAGEFVIEQGASLVNNRGMQIFHGNRQVTEIEQENFIRATEILSEWKGQQGDWLIVAGLKGLADFCLTGEEDNEEKCMTISGDGSRQPIPLHGLVEFEWKLKTSSEGCSTSGNSMPGTIPIVLLITLVGLGIRRRRR
ncbi:MYXO-CTERM sorting domain-containing protein [Patescibacteria group bacterium]